MQWTDAIEEYLRDQRQAGRINSVETVRSYKRVLDAHALDVPSGPLAACREDAKRTLARWEYPNTRARNHSALVSFYDWLLVEGHRKDNPARQVARTKMREASVVRLTRTEVVMLLAACETPRERRVVLLGVCAGARAIELKGFQGRHFDRPGFVWFSPDIAKGKRERWVPILPELAPTAEEIRRTVGPHHAVIRACDNSGVVFRAPTCQISHGSLGRLVAAIAERAGIARRVHPHLLRHAFGDHIARHAGLRAAQALMGHASVQTTASVYVDRPALEELAESVRGLRFGEELVRERRERFEEQMRRSTDRDQSVTNRTQRPLDIGRKGTVRWVIAR